MEQLAVKRFPLALAKRTLRTAQRRTALFAQGRERGRQEAERQKRLYENRCTRAAALGLPKPKSKQDIANEKLAKKKNKAQAALAKGMLKKGVLRTKRQKLAKRKVRLTRHALAVFAVLVYASVLGKYKMYNGNDATFKMNKVIYKTRDGEEGST